MQVSAHSYTQPVNKNSELLPSDLVAYYARVSNPSNQSNTLSADKLLRYLLKHKHYSPFEMVSVTMEVTTTRDIARQIIRHKSFAFQEFSQRYADPTKDLGFVLRDARLQDPSNRQNSIENSDEGLDITWKEMQQALVDSSLLAYRWAIGNGIAKEQARSVLPEGLTITKLYMAGTLRSWLHYCFLRISNGTQLEHQEVAEACWREIVMLYPALKNTEI